MFISSTPIDFQRGKNTVAYSPFGLGPLTYVGFNFAIAKTKIAHPMILQRHRFIIALPLILQRCRFTPSPTYVHSPVNLISMCPQHGLQAILQPF